MIDLLSDNMARIAVIAILIVTWFLLRSRATQLVSGAALDDTLASGRTVVMQFFSNT